MFFLATNFCICSSAYAEGEWHFPVGLSYFSGVSDIGDLFEDNIESQSTYNTIIEADVTVIPVGITFRPYYEFDSGVGIGMDFGPIMFLYSDQEYIDDVDFFNLPVIATCRYAFNSDGDVSPYVRAGVSYNISSGDYKEGSDPGLFAAVGIEFMRKKAVNMGIEVAYDSSEIEFIDLSNDSVSGRQKN